MDSHFFEFLKSKGLVEDYKGFIESKDKPNSDVSSCESNTTEVQSSISSASQQSLKPFALGTGDSVQGIKSDILDESPPPQVEHRRHKKEPKSKPKPKKPSVSTSRAISSPYFNQKCLNPKSVSTTSKHSAFTEDTFKKPSLKTPEPCHATKVSNSRCELSELGSQKKSLSDTSKGDADSSKKTRGRLRKRSVSQSIKTVNDTPPSFVQNTDLPTPEAQSSKQSSDLVANVKKRRPLSKEARISSSSEGCKNDGAHDTFESEERSQHAPAPGGESPSPNLKDSCSPGTDSKVSRGRPRKRSVSQSIKTDDGTLPSFFQTTDLPTLDAQSNNQSSDLVAHDKTRRPASKIARSSSVSESCKNDGTHGTFKSGEHGEPGGEPPSPNLKKEDSCSPGKSSVHSVMSNSSEILLGPDCYVKLTRISEEEIRMLSPKKAKQGLKSSGVDNVIDNQTMPAVKTLKLRGPNKSEAKGFVSVRKPIKTVEGTECNDAPQSSSAMFQDFYKPKPVVDPLAQMEVETNELDFEPGDDMENDGDDAISLFPPPDMFGIEEEELETAELHCDDIDSVASCGSIDSQSSSSDLDLEESHDGDSQFEVRSKSPAGTELGIVVENYRMSENPSSNAESSKVLGEVPNEVVSESTVSFASSNHLPARVLNNDSSNLLLNDRNSVEDSNPSNSEEEVASVMGEEPAGIVSNACSQVEPDTKDRNLETQQMLHKITEPQCKIDCGSNMSTVAKQEPTIEATHVTNSGPSTNKELVLQSEEKSVLNEVVMTSSVVDSSEASTSCESIQVSSENTSSPGTSIRNKASDKGSNGEHPKKKVPVKGSNDEHPKKKVPVKSDIGTVCNKYFRQQSNSLQTGALPVHPVNPWPRGTSDRQSSNNTCGVTPQQLNEARRERGEVAASLVPSSVYAGDQFSVQRNLSVDMPDSCAHVDVRPAAALLPTPPNNSPLPQLFTRSVENIGTLSAAGDGRTGLLPTPLTRLHRPPISAGGTPSTTPPRNEERQFIGPEVRFPLDNLSCPGQPPRIIQQGFGHSQFSQQQNSSWMGKSPMVGSSVTRTLSNVPDNLNQSERNFGPQIIPSLNHQGSSNRLRVNNPQSSIIQTAHGSSHPPWEEHKFMQPQHYEATRIKDTDMRNPLHRPGNEYSRFCPTFLKSGNCADMPACKSLHMIPPVVSLKDTSEISIVQSVKEMVSCPFWMNKNFQETIIMLGKFGSKIALQQICDILWERDCRCYSKTQRRQFWSDWIVLAEAFENCSLSPSKAVKEILQKVMSSDNQPAILHRDVLDSIVEALYERYIKDQRNVWEGISPLLRLKDYEIPIPVMREVLEDTMRDGREKQEHGQICDYLLRVPAVDQPRVEEQKSFRDLILCFIRFLKRNCYQESYSDKLAYYFKFPPNDLISFTASPAPPPIQRLSGSNNSIRFKVQNCAPMHEDFNQQQIAPFQSQPKTVFMGRTPTRLQGLQRYRVGPKRKSCSSAEKEVKSSTEGIPAPRVMPRNHEDLRPSCSETNEGKCSTFSSLQIVVEESGRKALLKKAETSTVQPDAEHGLVVHGNMDPSNQHSYPPCNLSEKPSTKLVDGIRPLDRVPKLGTHPPPSVPSTESNIVTGSNMPSSSLKKANPNTAKGAGRLKDQNVVSLIESKRFGFASSAIVNMSTPDDRKIGIAHISTTLKNMNYQESISSFKYLLGGVAGYWASAGSDSSSKSVIVSVGFILLKHLLQNLQWPLANQLYENLCSKVQPLEVEMEGFSKAMVLLMQAKVLFHSSKFPDALKIVEENKFFSLPENWTYPKKNDEDIEVRDELCIDLLKKCISIDAYNGKVDSLFRFMVMAKKSYKLDVDAIYPNVLQCLVHAKLLAVVVQLLVWAEPHGLNPDPLTSRLLLGQILKLSSPEQQNAYTPQVLYLLHLEPYKEAFPWPIQGLERVIVSLQSSWFEWEIQTIITFIVFCLSNLPDAQGLPDVNVEIKAAAPPVRTAGMEHFPMSLLDIDSSVAAMKERILKTLQKLQLVGARENFSGNTLCLNRLLIGRQVDIKRRSGQIPQIPAVQGQGILNTNNRGIRASSLPGGSYDVPSSQYSYPTGSDNFQQTENSSMGWYDHSNDMRSDESSPPGEGMHMQMHAYGSQFQYRPMYHDQGVPVHMPPQNRLSYQTRSSNSQSSFYNAPYRVFQPSRGHNSNRRGQRGRFPRWN